MALLALSHTPIEHRLYEALLAETGRAGTSVAAFSLRGLMALTGLGSYSTVRRACAGLVSKLSIDCQPVTGDGDAAQPAKVYLVYPPHEIFERRRRAGVAPYPPEYRRHASREGGFSAALERVACGYNLSRREAQVALCCAEGLTNAEIGERLFITEQTVKFHLRHVFVKCGVRRRSELISRLLRVEDVAGSCRGSASLAGSTGLTAG